MRERLLAGEQLVGLFVQTPHPVVTEVVCGAGVDVVCIDQEHAPIGVESLHALVGCATVPVLVRVPECAAHPISAALDAGASGVLVPRVSTAEQARQAVEFSRYPPLGRRGVGPGRASAYGRHVERELAEANDRAVVAVQVETRAAVDALDEIVAVEGVDVVFVGPGDLGASLGIGTDELTRVVDDVLARARNAGRRTGMFAPDAETAGRWLARGVDLLLVGSDLGFLAAAVEAAWNTYPRRGQSF